MKLRYFLCLPLLMSVTVVFADTDAVKAEIKKHVPELTIQSLTALENTGLYEAIIENEVYYFTQDGKHMIQGSVVSLTQRENLTETRRVAIKKELIQQIDTDSTIIFSPKNPDYMLTVFTDIDCGYCRKLHEEIAEYNALGIGVRYLAFPRAGVTSASAEKLVEVWCAKDQEKAMTDAKAQRKVKNSSQCADNPVSAHFELGRQLGVTGTPSMFLDNGQTLPGYIPPQRLKEILDDNAQRQVSQR